MIANDGAWFKPGATDVYGKTRSGAAATARAGSVSPRGQ
jgi:hypothetical protein